MEHTDVCFAPVLTMSEAAEHPHNVDRGTFVDVAGTMQPAPAPRFSPTTAEVTSRRPMPANTPRRSCATGASTPRRIDALIASGAVVAG